MALVLLTAMDTAASAHWVGYGRSIVQHFGLCTYGDGVIWDTGGAGNAIMWSGTEARGNNCTQPWQPYPSPWVQARMEVYEAGRYCGFVQEGNVGNSFRASVDENPAHWIVFCAGTPRPLSIDTIASVFNPNNGGFWQGGYVRRPTVTHNF